MIHAKAMQGPQMVFHRSLGEGRLVAGFAGSGGIGRDGLRERGGLDFVGVESSQSAVGQTRRVGLRRHLRWERVHILLEANGAGGSQVL